LFVILSCLLWWWPVTDIPTSRNYSSSHRGWRCLRLL